MLSWELALWRSGRGSMRYPHSEPSEIERDALGLSDRMAVNAHLPKPAMRSYNSTTADLIVSWIGTCLCDDLYVATSIFLFSPFMATSELRRRAQISKVHHDESLSTRTSSTSHSHVMCTNRISPSRPAHVHPTYSCFEVATSERHLQI